MKNNILDSRRVDSARGVVLVTALLVLSLLTILSMAAIMYTNINSKIARNYVLYQQMFYENEGVIELVPGLLRRTIALQSESSVMLGGMLITDANGYQDGDGISDADEAAVLSSLFVTDISLDGADSNITADFIDTIMGYTDDVDDPPEPYNLVVRINGYNTNLNLARGTPFTIFGFSTGFATGYGGGNLTGRAINYTSSAVKIGRENTHSSITTVYQCTERGGGGCL